MTVTTLESMPPLERRGERWRSQFWRWRKRQDDVVCLCLSCSFNKWAYFAPKAAHSIICTLTSETLQLSDAEKCCRSASLLLYYVRWTSWVPVWTDTQLQLLPMKQWAARFKSVHIIRRDTWPICIQVVVSCVQVGLSSQWWWLISLCSNLCSLFFWQYILAASELSNFFSFSKQNRALYIAPFWGRVHYTVLRQTLHEIVR